MPHIKQRPGNPRLRSNIQYLRGEIGLLYVREALFLFACTAVHSQIHTNTIGEGPGYPGYEFLSGMASFHSVVSRVVSLVDPPMGKSSEFRVLPAPLLRAYVAKVKVYAGKTIR